MVTLRDRVGRCGYPKPYCRTWRPHAGHTCTRGHQFVDHDAQVPHDPRTLWHGNIGDGYATGVSIHDVVPLLAQVATPALDLLQGIVRLGPCLALGTAWLPSCLTAVCRSPASRSTSVTNMDGR